MTLESDRGGEAAISWKVSLKSGVRNGTGKRTGSLIEGRHLGSRMARSLHGERERSGLGATEDDLHTRKRCSSEPEARQGCQRHGLIDSPRGRKRRAVQIKSIETRRSELGVVKHSNSPVRRNARTKARAFGDESGTYRGVGARSECVERQKSVGRISRRRRWQSARRVCVRRPSLKETTASLTRAVAETRRTGAHTSSRIITRDEARS